MDFANIQSRFSKLFEPTLLTAHPAEWGWRIPPGITDIYRIGYAVTLTPDLVQLAQLANVQLIITHHDAWEFLNEMRTQSLLQLEQYGIAHLFVHAPLDCADFGQSATFLNLTGCNEIGRFDREGDLYWGRYGLLPNPQPFAEFERNLSGVLGEKPRLVRQEIATIQRVAVVTGGGCTTAELKQACDLGCDTYITGELNAYILMYARYLKMNLLVYSHTATEIHGVEALVNLLIDGNPEVISLRLVEEMF